jgi:chromatin segregation and condensation protein Rec8/ScpA/Scc1 (kleisin family)
MEKSNTDRIMDILFNENEITWQAIIYELVRTEEMDPWDINISFLLRTFLEEMEKSKSMLKAFFEEI